jgi:uncharacterized protein YbcI
MRTEAGLQTSSDNNAELDGNRPLSMLSNELVRIYKEQFGRGPTKARSHFVGSNIVICVLENTLTPAEKNLQGMGEHQRLREMRMFFQYAVASEFIQAVERTIGRRVHSFVSGIDTNTDVAAEVFTLESAHPSDDSADGATGQI